MKLKYNYGTDRLFNFAQNSYLERTSRPIYSIVFLLPFIVFYELGTIFINADVLSRYWQGRVTTFVWLQTLLEYLGFSSKFAWAATPLAVLVILIGLQLASRKSWRFCPRDIWPMGIECILLAVPLIVLGLFLNSPATPQSDISRLNSSIVPVAFNTQYDNAVMYCSSVTNDDSDAIAEGDSNNGRYQGLLANIVTGIGAGIYEELVFRLILICLLMILFQDVLRLNQKNAIILSVLISAVMFSAHHHIDFLSGQLNHTDPFSLTKFSFRTIAGVYFAILFVMRGFGITAGTHAFYDIIAVLINAVFSTN